MRVSFACARARFVLATQAMIRNDFFNSPFFATDLTDWKGELLPFRIKSAPGVGIQRLDSKAATKILWLEPLRLCCIYMRSR